jgi:hypothetical protein
MRLVSWRRVGYVLGTFVAVAAVLAAIPLVSRIGERRQLGRAHDLADPLLADAGAGTVRSDRALARTPCGADDVRTLSMTAPLPGATGGIRHVAGHLRDGGWRVLELVTPHDGLPWVYATRDADTVVAWWTAADPPRDPESVLRVQVRLGDCYRLVAPAGTAEEPACAVGTWQRCVDAAHLHDRP